MHKVTFAVLGILVIGIFSLVMVDGAFLPKKYLEPWSGTYHTQFEDPRVQVLAHGVLAPNSHNLQSWRVVLEGENSFLLYVDPGRLSPKADPPGRQVTISQGTFLEYVGVAAGNLGYEAEMQLFPEGEYGPEGTATNLGSKPVARVILKETTRETEPESSILYKSMFVPDAYRVPYREMQLSKEDIETLEALSTENVTILIFQDPESLESLGNIVLRAAEVETGNDGIQKEGFELFRPNEWKKNEYRYGFSLDGQGLPAFNIHLMQGLISLFPFLNSPEVSGQSFLSQTESAVENTPAYALIITKGNSRTAQVEAGILYSRFLLAATDMGYAMQPMSQALEEYPEMAEIYMEIHEAYTGENETIQMLIRVGVPEKEVSPTMRLDVMDITEVSKATENSYIRL
ncbi:hypothetical protein MSSIT_1895 [Methanosarcina siciliae T4/M]|uniref:Nitroreductase domain-containing protein n=2 Tax=Methanosarcina siciliae TaxID=38027 RepID=A0A0E3PEG6_9EURY|nr:nitroreductase family protein [Methanosarcina siciliae]AKB28614.1 hypothetical protein MSSIT_1895 [Methanosarcina siciliae T4/M]AKB32529.1 hypothetical protein MSSIH_1839 [Methanosarcina siciliae HI350]